MHDGKIVVGHVPLSSWVFLEIPFKKSIKISKYSLLVILISLLLIHDVIPVYLDKFISVWSKYQILNGLVEILI